MPVVTMPRLSDSMQEGTVVRWLKQEGEAVKRGEEIVEIESDKATLAYEADSDGVLHIIAAEETTLAIGEPIAEIHGGQPDHEETAQKPIQEQEPAQEVKHPPEQSAPQPMPQTTTPPQSRVHASPVARRIAREQGIDLETVQGSGPQGRIVRSDVENLLSPHPQAEHQQQSQDQTPKTAKGSAEQETLSRNQRTIARRMAQSKATIPDFSVSVEVDMERCVELRSELRELNEGKLLPTYNDMLVKACAIALEEYPRVNGCYQDEQFLLHERINVGIAVAGNETLIVPTITDADRQTLQEIASQTKILATHVREGTITPPQVSGTTFTISNLGMLGAHSFTAIITPGQAAILTVGSIEQRPVCHDGQIVARHTMVLTLTCDHRILYGADAANFLARVRALLEHPAGLLT